MQGYWRLWKERMARARAREHGRLSESCITGVGGCVARFLMGYESGAILTVYSFQYDVFLALERV